MRSESEEAQTKRSLLLPHVPGVGTGSRSPSGGARPGQQSWAVLGGGTHGGAAWSTPGASLLPRDRLTKDDIYIFPEASNFLIYHLSAPEALPCTRDVCPHLMIPFAKQTSPSLRGNSLTLPRLLIPSINVTLSVARGIRGSCWHPAPRGSWGQFAGSSSQRGNHGNRPWRGC